MSAKLFSQGDLLAFLGRRAKERRLGLGLRQADLAALAGVGLPTLRRFESGTSVGLDAVLSIALALRAEDGFLKPFEPVESRSLQDILDAQKRRVRARKRA